MGQFSQIALNASSILIYIFHASEAADQAYPLELGARMRFNPPGDTAWLRLFHEILNQS
jgi:hypothetical protein